MCSGDPPSLTSNFFFPVRFSFNKGQAGEQHLQVTSNINTLCRITELPQIYPHLYDRSWRDFKDSEKAFKGIVHPKMKILSSFTHPQVVPNLYECLSSAEHKGRYSEECGKQSSSGAPLTSIVFFFQLWKSMVPQNSLVTNFLQNIFLCVWQNKEIHTGLELLEGK